MDKQRIVVEVSGGVVQAVYSTRPVDVVLVDHDNLEAEGKGWKERDAILADACKGMAQHL